MAFKKLRTPSDHAEPAPVTLEHERYAELIGKIYSQGSWFMKPLTFRLILSADHGDVLAYLFLIRTQVQYAAATRGNEVSEWFYCSMDRFENHLFISRRNQTRIMAELKRRGFIDMKMSGIPARRYIKINAVFLHEEIEKALAARRPAPKADEDGGS